MSLSGKGQVGMSLVGMDRDQRFMGECIEFLKKTQDGARVHRHTRTNTHTRT